MAGVTQDVTDLGVEVTDLGDEIDVIDGEIAVILTGQVIQDERILELEADSEGQISIRCYNLIACLRIYTCEKSCNFCHFRIYYS